MTRKKIWVCMVFLVVLMSASVFAQSFSNSRNVQSFEPGIKNPSSTFGNYNNYGKIILETKTQNTTISNYIDEKFFFEKIKFSKYCDAIDNVKRS